MQIKSNLGVYMIYQDVQITKLESKLAHLKSQLHKVATVITNATAHETEALGHELNELIIAQRLQQLEGHVLEYAESLQSGLMEIKLCFQNLPKLHWNWPPSPTRAISSANRPPRFISMTVAPK